MNKTYNQVLEKLILPMGDFLLKSSFLQVLQECRQNDLMNAEALEELQSKRLKDTLKHAMQSAPFYKKLSIESSSDPIKCLRQFPIITKETLRKEQDKLFTQPKKKLVKQVSSGSSGIQSTVFLSKYEESVPRAQQTRWWEWAGYHLGDPILQTGMATTRSPVKRLKDLLLRSKYVHAFALSPEEIRDILIYAKERRIPNFYGYASSLFLFAEVAQEYGLDLSFSSMVCWGDKMFDHYRRKVKKVFKANVLETYGCAEGLMIAAQKDLPYLYIMTPWIFLELLDENGREVQDGEIGHVVVTSLSARSFPLIRYQLGDLAIKLPRSQYPAQREFKYPLLKKVIGRDTDIIRTRSGKSMIVHSFTGIFEYYPEIQQFQVIQEDIDQICIKYIPFNTDKSIPERTLIEIKNRITRHLEEDFHINFRKVNQILPSPSGKPQIIISKL